MHPGRPPFTSARACTPVIHLVRLSAPIGIAGQRVESLARCRFPLAVRCSSPEHVAEFARWRAQAPATTAGAVCVAAPRNPELLRSLMEVGGGIDPLVFIDELHAGEVLPGWAITRLLANSLVGELCHELCGARDPPDPRLAHLVSAALEGRNVGTVARRMGMSEATLRRRMRNAGLTAPKGLLRDLRLIAVERQVASGIPLHAAVRACGWSSPPAYYVARRRAGESSRSLPSLHALLVEIGRR